MLTTFAPAENSTFVLNGWFMHTQSHIYTFRSAADEVLEHNRDRSTYLRDATPDG